MFVDSKRIVFSRSEDTGSMSFTPTFIFRFFLLTCYPKHLCIIWYMYYWRLFIVSRFLLYLGAKQTSINVLRAFFADKKCILFHLSWLCQFQSLNVHTNHVRGWINAHAFSITPVQIEEGWKPHRIRSLTRWNLYWLPKTTRPAVKSTILSNVFWQVQTKTNFYH